VLALPEQGQGAVLVPGEDAMGAPGHSRGPKSMDVAGEDVKPDIASLQRSQTPLPPPPPTTTATQKKKKAHKAEARPLCDMVSDDFTVWGGKG
jgi:hypothetical protein